LLHQLLLISIFNIYQLDIKAAYPNAELDENLYMEIPQGMKGNGYLHLKKTIYGLKQASRLWNEKLSKTLHDIGFERYKSEPCIYIKKDKYNKICCIIAIYID